MCRRKYIFVTLALPSLAIESRRDNRPESQDNRPEIHHRGPRSPFIDRILWIDPASRLSGRETATAGRLPQKLGLHPWVLSRFQRCYTGIAICKTGIQIVMPHFKMRHGKSKFLSGFLNCYAAF